MIRFPWRPGGAPAGGESVPAGGSVRGERGASLASGARSLQSRMSSVLAAGLMASVGAAMLAWYYTEALSHPAAVHARASTPPPEVPGGGMTLPPFGPAVSPVHERPPLAATGAEPIPASPLPQVRAAEPVAGLPASPLLGMPLAPASGQLHRRSEAPEQPSPRQRRLDRRLSGEVFAQALHAAPSGLAADRTEERAPRTGPGAGSLETLLRPGVLVAARAERLPTQRLLLPKGTFIDCTLETAIDSTLPGMTTCITATDTFGADGTVVLLERGTKLIGETRGEVRQGEARVFVVWMEARTPTGVVVQLESPGTDALGRSGLAGTVDRHFWQRFGAAALVSTLDGVVQSRVQSPGRGGTVVLDPTASEDVMTEILRSTVNIPPTVRVPNGARIQVLAARDLDFRTVYELAAR